MAKKILLIAGEPSGDLHAGNLAFALKNIQPDIELFGVGGRNMDGAGVKIIQDIQGLSCFGVFDALFHIKHFLDLENKLLTFIKTNPPDLIVLVDFSGFNLRFAKKINNQVPIIYYISPQVWASRAGRIKTIKKYIRKMLVIFAFEKKLYQEKGVDVEFVGHPLLDIVKPTLSQEEAKKEFGLKDNKTTITLLPGSRKPVVKRHLPIMLKTASIINTQQPHQYQFIIAKSPNIKEEIFKEGLSQFKDLDIRIVEDKTYDCLNVADFVITSSGTATIETAIMEKPMVILYQLDLLAYLLYRPQVKVPYIGMVNIVAGNRVVPEFIQFKAKPHLIAKETLEILNSEDRLNNLKRELHLVKNKLGPPQSAQRAARIILSSC